jgi:hypothetical protein
MPPTPTDDLTMTISPSVILLDNPADWSARKPSQKIRVSVTARDGNGNAIPRHPSGRSRSTSMSRPEARSVQARPKSPRPAIRRRRSSTTAPIRQPNDPDRDNGRRQRQHFYRLPESAEKLHFSAGSTTRSMTTSRCEPSIMASASPSRWAAAHGIPELTSTRISLKPRV